jgi:hypothetical protein
MHGRTLASANLSYNVNAFHALQQFHSIVLELCLLRTCSWNKECKLGIIKHRVGRSVASHSRLVGGSPNNCFVRGFIHSFLHTADSIRILFGLVPARLEYNAMQCIGPFRKGRSVSQSILPADLCRSWFIHSEIN